MKIPKIWIAGVLGLGIGPACGNQAGEDAGKAAAATSAGADASHGTTTGPLASSAPPSTSGTTAGSPSTASSPSTAPVASMPSTATSTPTGSSQMPEPTGNAASATASSPAVPQVSSSADSPVPSTPSAVCGLTADRVRITEIDLGAAVVANEDEAALRPLVISPLANGGSRLAWYGEDDALHISELAADDSLTGASVSLPARDFSDVLADDTGGYALLTRDALGGGNRNCGTLTNLCGSVESLPERYACWDMYIVRFDAAGETWATKVTESAADAPPYLSGPLDEASRVYIWEAYAHHGRLATDGSNVAGYFGAAISVSQDCVQPDTSQPQGVNIHQGDRMQVVAADGSLLTGHNSFGWGCSHSGYERLVWDPTAARFVAVCKTDNNNRLALAPNYATIRAVDLAANNISDLVLAPSGYWLATSDVEEAGGGNADVSLLRFSIAGNDVTLDDEVPVSETSGVNERAPYLAKYGSDGLLVGWESSSKTNDLTSNDSERELFVQVRRADTGAAVGEPVGVAVPGNRYQSFRAFPDGSVAFPARGSSSTTVRVVRVLPCAAP